MIPSCNLLVNTLIKVEEAVLSIHFIHFHVVVDLKFVLVWLTLLWQMVLQSCYDLFVIYELLQSDYKLLDNKYFQLLNGAEKGERAALLLSPSSLIPITTADSSHSPCGSPFTIFLTAPLQALCLLLGFSGSEIEMVSRTVEV